MHLFQSGDFFLTSGGRSSFKIECNALTPDDWDTLARMIADRAPRYIEVVGVPRGGEKLAKALERLPIAGAYHSTCERLVVDDVWTTGASILKLMRTGDFGFVVFARSPIPARFNVRALFTLDA
jgi:orotate phosphoribosyltransferase